MVGISSEAVPTAEWAALSLAGVDGGVLLACIQLLAGTLRNLVIKKG